MERLAGTAGRRPAPAATPSPCIRTRCAVMRGTASISPARQAKHLSVFAGHRFDYVISLCDRVREVCPELPGPAEPIHWSIPDPAGGHRPGTRPTPPSAPWPPTCTPASGSSMPRVDGRQAGEEGMRFANDIDDMVSVRYMVDDVQAAIDFYTTHFGFTLGFSAVPAFADVTRGHLRLLLAGPASSAGRPMPDGRVPGPGGWNRIHLIVADLAGEVDRLRTAGVRFRNDVVTGPGGQQILLEDPAGNPVELFQPAGR